MYMKVHLYLNEFSYYKGKIQKLNVNRQVFLSLKSLKKIPWSFPHFPNAAKS